MSRPNELDVGDVYGRSHRGWQLGDAPHELLSTGLAQRRHDPVPPVAGDRLRVVRLGRCVPKARFPSMAAAMATSNSALESYPMHRRASIWVRVKRVQGPQ
jgi:hypothetical protein